jgi:hypothetical protein
MTTIQFKIPVLLDLICVSPVLLYRLLRYGWAYRKIPLGEGRFTIVDPLIFYRLNKFNWAAKRNKNDFYAVRFIDEAGKFSKISSMHREIMGNPEGYLVDHRNNNALDNRMANLRPATRSQNACNKLKRRTDTTSKYRGVCWREDKRKWQAKIYYQKKEIFLGYFDSEIDAAKAYDAAALKHHREFARLNFQD